MTSVLNVAEIVWNLFYYNLNTVEIIPLIPVSYNQCKWNKNDHQGGVAQMKAAQMHSLASYYVNDSKSIEFLIEVA